MKIQNNKENNRSRSWLQFLLISALLLMASSPMQEEYPPGNWDKIIENQDFTAPLKLEKGDDNVLIINSTFHDFKGDAITLRNVSNVYIKNCRIFNIDGNGIVLRSTGDTNRVTIDGCTIENTTKNGIIAKQDHINKNNQSQLRIKNNILDNNGDDELNHSIYIQSQDSIIQDNEIHNTPGNGISIRSSGIIRGNKIWDTEKSCIRYFNDNKPGPSNTLLIENNVCYQSREGERSPGISLLAWENADPQWAVGNYVIRFNTIVMFTQQRVGIEVESAQFASKRVVVYGNIVINTQDINATIREDHIDYLSQNYVSTSIDGFANLKTMPYDFHLTEKSPAINYANNEIDFPRTDADGAARSIKQLDAGAYQLPRDAAANSLSVTEAEESAQATRRAIIRYGSLSVAVLLFAVFRKRILNWIHTIPALGKDPKEPNINSRDRS